MKRFKYLSTAFLVAAPVLLGGCFATNHYANPFDQKKANIDKLEMWDIELFYKYTKPSTPDNSIIVTPNAGDKYSSISHDSLNTNEQKKLKDIALLGENEKKALLAQLNGDSRGAYFWDAYCATQDNKKNEVRNKIMHELMTIIDDNYYMYEQKVRNSMVLKNAFIDVITQALSVSGTLIKPGDTKGIFSALNGGVLALNSGFDKNVLAGNMIEAIMKQMRANRDSRASKIYKSMKQNDTDYPLVSGLHDLTEYYRDGSLVSAIISISQDASVKASKSDNEKMQNKSVLEKVTTTGATLQKQVSDLQAQVNQMTANKDNKKILQQLDSLQQKIQAADEPKK